MHQGQQILNLLLAEALLAVLDALQLVGSREVSLRLLDTLGMGRWQSYTSLGGTWTHTAVHSDSAWPGKRRQALAACVHNPTKPTNQANQA